MVIAATAPPHQFAQSRLGPGKSSTHLPFSMGKERIRCPRAAEAPSTELSALPHYKTLQQAKEARFTASMWPAPVLTTVLLRHRHRRPAPIQWVSSRLYSLLSSLWRGEKSLSYIDDRSAAASPLKARSKSSDCAASRPYPLER